ncbi:MAG: hypothetical protein WA323_09115 [Candidatus Nitrosopolaris sp.]
MWWRVPSSVYMDSFGNMSIFLQGKPIQADPFDVDILLNIMNGYESVYKLHTKMEEIKPITYKNVLRRVHKLYESRVIEPIEGNFKHGAINYRLTSRGLMYLFSTGTMPVYIDEVIIKYPDNILFKVLIYNYFEKSTLRDCTYTLERFLSEYVAICCQIIASHLTTRFKIQTDVMNAQLRWQNRSFILNLATAKDELIGWRDQKENDRQETLELLANDKKFLTVLKEYGEEFLKCYDMLITLSKHR